ncbi:MAG: flagellar filament capping protein FliD [Anaerohalosphaeraceae bacterium]
MASISLSGLSTGIDTSSIISQLMEVEGQRLTKYSAKLVKYQEKQTAITELQTKLSSFKSSIYSISDTSKMKAFNTNTSDSDVVTAEATSSASEGNHSIKIKQLATSERWVHSGFRYATSYVGEGNFIYSYNNSERVIQTTDTTTLQDLVDLINNDPENPGVTASMLKYDNGDGNEWHLVLSGNNSGEDYQVTVNSSNTEVHTAQTILKKGGNNAEISTQLKNLDGFTGTIESGTTADKIRISGTGHDGSAVNYTFDVTQYTTIEDLVREMETAFGNSVEVTYEEGMLKVTDKSSGTSQLQVNLAFEAGTGSSASLTLPTISRTTQGGSKTANIASLAAGTFTETQSAKNALIKVDDYPPDVVDVETGEMLEEKWISRSSNTIDNVIAGVTLKLHDTTVSSESSTGYTTVEVNLTRNTEELKKKITTMVDSYNELATYFKEQTTYDTETKTSGILSSDYSLTSILNLVKNPLRSVATGFGSSDSFTRPEDIGLKINADGTLELDTEVFDEAIVDDYMGVLSLFGAQKTGLSTGADAAYVSFYASSKYTDAGTYDVQVVVDETTHEITSARIKLTSESWSRARTMKVSGKNISGSSELDGSKNPLYPEFDLNLTVDTSKTGTLNTTIQIKQGFAGAMYESVDSSLKTGGRVPLALDSINDQISTQEDRITKEQSRLETYETRLRQKYARLEKMLNQIQQQFSGIM